MSKQISKPIATYYLVNVLWGFIYFCMWLIGAFYLVFVMYSFEPSGRFTSLIPFLLFLGIVFFSLFIHALFKKYELYEDRLEIRTVYGVKFPFAGVGGSLIAKRFALPLSYIRSTIYLDDISSVRTGLRSMARKNNFFILLKKNDGKDIALMAFELPLGKSEKFVREIKKLIKSK